VKLVYLPKLYNMTITEMANYIISKKGRPYLLKKLDITAPTMRTRLKLSNWKLPEKAMIEMIIETMDEINALMNKL